MAMTLGTMDKELLPTPGVIERVTAEINKIMPETFEGEHAARMNTLAHGDEQEAKLEAFQLFVYQVSNKLIEDPDFDICDPNWDSEDSRWSRMIDVFRSIGLPRRSWVQLFRTNSGGLSRTSSAFIENLLEAAVQCQGIDVAEALLEAGADPDRPMYGTDNRTLTPLQCLADQYKPCNVDLVKLLLQAGADVEATGSDKRPPVVVAAERGTLELVKLLVEHGANIRRRVETFFLEPVDTHCALIAAISSSRGDMLRSRDGRDRRTGESDSDTWLQGLGSTQKFGYLLALYDKDASLDRAIIQDAFVTAAHLGRVDMMKALAEAGATAEGWSLSGITPLVAAAWRHHETVPASDFLLRMGASPDPTRQFSRGIRPSALTALHISAAVGDAELTQLLADHGADVNTTTNFCPREHAPLLGWHFLDDRLVTRSKILSRFHTSLQLALHKDSGLGGGERKSQRSAMVLLAAGARLIGGELVQAVSFNSAELVQTLLEKGANPNEKNGDGATALQKCLREGFASLAGVLLDAGASLEGGELFHACKCGNRDVFDMLVAHGATLEDRGPNGESCLEGAVLGKNSDLVDWVIAMGPSSYDDGALCAAVFAKKAQELSEQPGELSEGTEELPEDAEELSEVAEDLSEEAEELSEEEEEQDQDLITRLLQSRPGVPFRPSIGASALGYAAYHGDWDVFDRLRHVRGLGTCVMPLRDEYDGCEKLVLHSHWFMERAYEQPFWHNESMIRCSPLIPAILSGEWTAVDDLLKMGYRPDPLTLLVAIKTATPQQISQLLAHGAQPNIAARHFLDTPLQLAARLGRVDTVRLLLRRGANVNGLPAVLVPTPAQIEEYSNRLLPRTALQAAVEIGNVHLVDMLLAAGADVNGAWALDGGASALQLAAAKGHLGVVRRLASLGADIDARRAEILGRTALEGAAEQGRLDTVQFLLALGAKTTGEWGRWQYLRAVGFAAKNGHRSVERLLHEWRAWDAADRTGRLYPELLSKDFQESFAEEWWCEYRYCNGASSEEDEEDDGGGSGTDDGSENYANEE